VSGRITSERTIINIGCVEQHRREYERCADGSKAIKLPPYDDEVFLSPAEVNVENAALCAKNPEQQYVEKKWRYREQAGRHYGREWIQLCRAAQEPPCNSKQYGQWGGTQCSDGKCSERQADIALL
jgi:hypothetical protein